jgi:hypothetical protein
VFGCHAISQGKTISKRYLLTYPDGSRKHIDRAERDSLVLAQQAKQTANGNYLYTGQQHTFHSFAELSVLTIANPQQIKPFLPGYFIVEHKEKRTREYLESPEHLALRISQ